MPRRVQRAAILILIAVAAVFWYATRGEADIDVASSVDQSHRVSESNRNEPIGGGALAAADSKPEEKRGDSFFGASDAGTKASDWQRAIADALHARARLADQQVDAFCDMQKKFQNIKPFAREPGVRDAAVFMGNRVDWSTEGEIVRIGQLHVPENVAAQLRGPKWLTTAVLLVAPTDLSWWAALADFDVWTAVNDGLLKDSPAAQGIGGVAGVDCGSLILQSRLRFAAAAAAGPSPDWAAASRDVQQLAFLLHSMGLAVADVCAATILNAAEGQAYDQAVAAFGVATLSGWSPVDQNQLREFRQLAVSAPEFVGPSVSAATRAKALACTEKSHNRCAMVTEALGLIAAFKTIAPDALNADAMTGCDPRSLQRAMSRHGMSKSEGEAFTEARVESLLPVSVDGG